MDTTLALAAAMRWIHILAAVTVAGSIFFYVIVLRPAMRKSLDPAQSASLRDAMMRRWKMLVHPSILLFLVSGFYNYLQVTAPLHNEQPLYHALFGVKFLLAILLFALAIVLTSTRAWSVRWRESGAAWIVLTLVTVAVVLIGGVMKVMPATDTEVVEVELLSTEN